MTDNLKSKKRIVAICELKERLAGLDYLETQKSIAGLHASRRNLSALAENMFDTTGCCAVYDLAARLEFGSRLIGLRHQQDAKISSAKTNLENAAKMLSIAKHRSGFAHERYNSAKVIADDRYEQNRRHISTKPRLINIDSNDGGMI